MIVAKRILQRAKRRHGTWDSREARTEVGMAAGIVGVVLNLLLASAKLVFGVLSHSMALVTDGINNAADAVSSVVVIMGLKMAASPPDRDHPYGHGRLEYVAGLVVSFMVLAMGLEFLSKSAGRILHPVVLASQSGAVLFMVLAMAVKWWMRFFYHAIARKTNHIALEAASKDSRGDALITGVVLISYVAGHYTRGPIDGIVGVLVSLLIIHSGVELVRETISPLIGEAPDDSVLNAIKVRTENEPLVIGTHDLLVHNYGPGRTIATMDVEFDADLDLLTVHDVMDRVETDIRKQHGIELVLHMDPRYLIQGKELELFDDLESWVKEHEDIMNIHDFRKRKQEDGSFVFCFDLKVDGEKSKHLQDFSYYENAVRERMERYFPGHAFHMNVDIAFRSKKD